MRFPLAALFFIVSAFVFFVFWAVSSYLISVVGVAMTPLATELGSAEYSSELTLIPYAFGIICAIFFVTGVILIFVMDSLADEPEVYYRRY